MIRKEHECNVQELATDKTSLESDLEIMGVDFFGRALLSLSKFKNGSDTSN